MGANLCTLRQSFLGRHALGEADTGKDTELSAVTMADFLKPKNPKMMKKRKKSMAQEMKTLEEWLFASPMRQHCPDTPRGVPRQLRGQSPRVCPVSPKFSYRSAYSTPRGSFSDDGAAARRSRSEKKVSFRLPEEADIHIICYHCENSEER